MYRFAISTALAAMIACTAPAPETEVTLAGKTDVAVKVDLDDDTPRHVLKPSCTGPDGCRVRMTLWPERNDWLRDQHDISFDLADIEVTSGDELIVSTTFRESHIDGVFRTENGDIEFILPPGPAAIAFDKGELPPALTISVNMRGPSIAPREVRELCHQSCDLYEVGQCLTDDVAVACHNGCAIAAQHEVDQFTKCSVGSSDRCDTFCFFAIPGVTRFSGGCMGDMDEDGVDEDICPVGKNCQVGVCVPDQP